MHQALEVSKRFFLPSFQTESEPLLVHSRGLNDRGAKNNKTLVFAFLSLLFLHSAMWIRLLLILPSSKVSIWLCLKLWVLVKLNWKPDRPPRSCSHCREPWACQLSLWRTGICQRFSSRKKACHKMDFRLHRASWNTWMFVGFTSYDDG